MPERLFRVGPVEGDPARTVGRMLTGPWTAGRSGEPCAGALGVLLDDVLGYAVVAARPAGSWAVSTDISVDFCGPLPASGTVLRCESRTVQRDAAGGLAVGQVTDPAGTVIAVGRERLRFVGRQPVALTSPAAGEPAAGELSLAEAPPWDLLGLSAAPRDGGLRLCLEPTARLANPLDNLHGGVQFCAVEIAGAMALRPGAAPLATSSVTMAFVRPVSLAGPVLADATVRHRGRTMGVASVLVRDASGRTCTIATVTAHAPVPAAG